MTLIRTKPKNERLSTFAEAAEILGISSESVRRKLCGTESLTHVAIPGTKLKRVILSEVYELRDQWIGAAKKSRTHGLRLVA